MADDLKRVGLVFKEDGAVNFRKTLQEVNVELNKNYNQFKLTQSQWDSSTKKTEKLRAQQQYLTNAYEIQSDKVSVLERQLEELESAEDRDTLAIKRKRNELTNAQVKLENYKKQLEEVSSRLESSGRKITEFGEKVEKTGGKIENAGKKASAFSAATAAALATSAKAAIDFETAFTGVEKTVDETVNTSFEDLKQGIRDMAKEIPSSTTEISAVAEAAGQLGISADDVLSFTRVMIDLGNSTNLSAEEAASSLAKFANVTKMSTSDYDKLGAVIVALGNNFATTEADIVSMATRLASTGELTGLTEAQIMALATAMSSVGIEAEAGGSAMSKLLKKMQVAVETGTQSLDNLTNWISKSGYSINDLSDALNKGGDTLKSFSNKVGINSKDLKSWYNDAVKSAGALEDFSDVAGMTAEEFKQAFEKDALSALSAFISGLNDTERNGASAIAILEDMGLTEVRLSNTVLSLANASSVMNKAVEMANEEWQDNAALTNEANKRYQTLQSKINICLNKAKDMGITLGNKLMPSIEGIITKVGQWIEKFNSLSDKEVDIIVKTGLVVAAAGPLIMIVGKTIKVFGTGAKVIGTFITALEVASGTAVATTKTVDILAKSMAFLATPTGAACGVIVAGITAIAISANESTKATEEAFKTMGDSAMDFIKGIETATSHLDSFNSTLFVSAEEQQKLQEDMQEVQNGITTICKTASDERRGYTQEEITQLDEYFAKLKELKNRELEIQKNIGEAITQQAEQNVQNFQGSMEEYQIQSEEMIKTAEDQAKREISIINDRTIQELALLRQKYGQKATMENEEYAREYNNIIENKDKAIQEANDEVAKVNSVYANGYLERVQQNDGFFNTLQEQLSKVEEENQRHSDKMKEIDDYYIGNVIGQNMAEGAERDSHRSKLQKIWNDMYKNMTEEQEKELANWITRVAQTEMYGGEIDDETKKIVDSIMDCYDSMPPRTRKVMKQAMDPLLEEMENKEPSLFAKAKSIGDGIINRLMKAFDEHSPSKLTRKIMRFAMEPMEDEMEKGKKRLFKEAEKLGEGITDRLNDIDSDIEFSGSKNKQHSNKNNISNKYTFNMNVYCQKLDEAELDQIFNYVNKKFGNQYS